MESFFGDDLPPEVDLAYYVEEGKDGRPPRFFWDCWPLSPGAAVGILPTALSLRKGSALAEMASSGLIIVPRTAARG